MNIETNDYMYVLTIPRNHSEKEIEGLKLYINGVLLEPVNYLLLECIEGEDPCLQINPRVEDKDKRLEINYQVSRAVDGVIAHPSVKKTES